MKGLLELLFIPQLNQDTNYFSSIVESSARDLHCFVIQANTSVYGDSRITAPYKSVNKNVLQIKGGDTDVLLVSEIDVVGLKNFREEYLEQFDMMMKRCFNCSKILESRNNDYNDICKKCFEKVIDGDIDSINANEYKLKFFDGTSMSIHVLENEKVVNQLNGMTKYYEKINIENLMLKENILKQISLSNSIVYFEFYKDENENRNNIIASILFEVAKESAGLLILPNLSIYTHEMKLLLSSRGATEYTKYHPIARKDTSITIEKLADKFDKERIKSNVEYMKKLNLPSYEKMTNVPLDKNTALNEMVVIINNLILM